MDKYFNEMPYSLLTPSQVVEIAILLTFSMWLITLQMVKFTTAPLFVYLFVNKPATQQFAYGNALYAA